MTHSKSSTLAKIGSCSGVTLIEVLVSMIIMSVGIVLLATLLPISILRTAQATQMTHAVFVKNNVNAILQANPLFLGNSQISTGGANTVNGVTYAVIDPLACTYPPTPPTFGPPMGGYATLPRFNGGASTFTQAEALAQLPDSWSPVMEGSVTSSLSATPPHLTWTGNPPISNLLARNGQFPQYAPHRLVMSDALGKTVALRQLFRVSGQDLYWWNVDGTGAPLTYGAPNPTFTPLRVRIEVMQRRFTWMMTIKKQPLSLYATDTSSWMAEVDLAVFFNRSFNTAEETPLSASIVSTGFDQQLGVRGVDDDNNGHTDDLSESGWPGSDDNRTVKITWAAAANAPPLRKGGYMLEPSQLAWYKIVNLDYAGPTSLTATLLLDRDIRSPSAVSHGIFMKGIIDVYPLGIQTGSQ